MVTRQEIEKLAKLARLSFDDEGYEKLTEEMKEIIEFADTINHLASGVDVKVVESETVPLKSLREDEVKESFDNELITSNVEAIDGFIPVKRSRL